MPYPRGNVDPITVTLSDATLALIESMISAVRSKVRHGGFVRCSVADVQLHGIGERGTCQRSILFNDTGRKHGTE